MISMSNSSEKQTVVDQAAAQLRSKILTGGYAPGDVLPGERELSVELGVSRLTLRAALSHLSSEGLVQSVHGSGTRVLDYRQHGDVALLGHLAELALTGHRVGLQVIGGLLELRRAVAVEAIGIAAERATIEELRAMRAAVAHLATLLADPHAFMTADLAFARMLVRATKNLAFELLFNTVQKTIEGNPGVEIAFFANAPATIAVYGRLLDRMEARDETRARLTAGRLLHRLDRTTLDRIALVIGSLPEPPPPPPRAVTPLRLVRKKKEKRT
jgi:GntR family transcriptional regulator, transcriptional repressor for pyruvate dehydrogenase complex